MLRARRLMLLCALLLASCRAGPLPPVPAGAARPVASPAEAAKRCERSAALAAEGRLDEALAEIDQALAAWPPEALRRRLLDLAHEIRRGRFYRDHPVHLALSIDRERYSFGERAAVLLTVTNLGRERLRLLSGFRTLRDLLTLRAGERSSLLLQVEVRDADGLGSAWSARSVLDVPLEHDLVLAPGGREEIRAEVPLDGGERSLFRCIRVGAIYRPLAILGESGERRYDPLEFPEASARVFHREHALWAEGGVELLAATLAGEPAARSEALFVAAAGLEPAGLRAGIDLLARAAPSLDPVRQRRAVAALALLTRQSLADDAVRFLGWWEGTGKLLSDGDLRERAGLAGARSSGRLEAGAVLP